MSEVDTRGDDSFRKAVLCQLVLTDHSKKWLAEEITRRTGLYCDTSYIAKVLRGERVGKKIRAAMIEILHLEKQISEQGKET